VIISSSKLWSSVCSFNFFVTINPITALQPLSTHSKLFQYSHVKSVNNFFRWSFISREHLYYVLVTRQNCDWKLLYFMFRIVFWDVQLFYTAVHPRRQLWTSYSPSWESEISHVYSSSCRTRVLSVWPRLPLNWCPFNYIQRFDLNFPLNNMCITHPQFRISQTFWYCDPHD
jgi:hypothetical protein